jgi:hypothetical protein
MILLSAGITGMNYHTWLYFIFAMLRMDPIGSHMLGKCFTTELYPRLVFYTPQPYSLDKYNWVTYFLTPNSFFFLFFLWYWDFELRASHLLGRHLSDNPPPQPQPRLLILYRF